MIVLVSDHFNSLVWYDLKDSLDMIWSRLTKLISFTWTVIDEEVDIEV